jgi:hypothetical protein
MNFDNQTEQLKVLQESERRRSLESTGAIMCKRLSARWISLICLVGSPELAHATDFPSQLWGKSVLVAWNSLNDQAPASMSDTEFCVYVSGAGRNFSRLTARGSRSALSDPASPDDTVSTQREVYFADGVLWVDAKMHSGAIRVAITFDGMYGKCTAKVTSLSTENGPRVHQGNASGCSIVAGNALVAR